MQMQIMGKIDTVSAVIDMMIGLGTNVRTSMAGACIMIDAVSHTFAHSSITLRAQTCISNLKRGSATLMASRSAAGHSASGILKKDRA